MQMITRPSLPASISVQVTEAIAPLTRSKRFKCNANACWTILVSIYLRQSKHFDCDAKACWTVIISLCLRSEGGESDHWLTQSKRFDHDANACRTVIISIRIRSGDGDDRLAEAIEMLWTGPSVATLAMICPLSRQACC